MTTSFHVTYDSVLYELFAERVSETETLETWRVASRGDVNRFITVTNNRPALHAKGQYKAYYKWTIAEGDAMYKRIVALITSQLEYYIRGLWKPEKKGKAVAAPENTSPHGRLF